MPPQLSLWNTLLTFTASEGRPHHAEKGLLSWRAPTARPQVTCSQWSSWPCTWMPLSKSTCRPSKHLQKSLIPNIPHSHLDGRSLCSAEGNIASLLLEPIYICAILADNYTLFTCCPCPQNIQDKGPQTVRLKVEWNEMFSLCFSYP